MSLRKTMREANSRGLIPGPDESDEHFFRRCAQAKKVSTPPHSSSAERLFDISPDWVSVTYSNKRLRFWEGGCTWIEGTRITLQLNKAFEKKKRYLGIYSKEELLAHELLHVVRSHFDEPVFEEILAYQTSKSPLRRALGPIFRTPKESIFFLIALLGISFAVFFTPFHAIAYAGMVGVLSGGFFRLLRAKRIFSKTRKKLSKLVGRERALPLMVRLSDREIIRFSQMSEEEITHFAKKVSKASLRWKILCETYFGYS